jgi:hypothetical protein
VVKFNILCHSVSFFHCNMSCWGLTVFEYNALPVWLAIPYEDTTIQLDFKICISTQDVLAISIEHLRLRTMAQEN